MNALLLDGLLGAILAWFALGLLGPFLAMQPQRQKFIPYVFIAGALVALVVAGLGLFSLWEAQRLLPQTRILPLGLPGLPFHLRLDALSSVFVLLLGFASAGISLYAAGYFRHAAAAAGAPGGLCLAYHLFLLAMLLVLLADDAYGFMVAWEGMALVSFLLVCTDHRHGEIRRAAYLYLLMAHIGAIALLLSFGLLASGGDYTFAAMRTQTHGPVFAASAWLLALFGFGAKAGIIPLHVWLPLAHPAAPSPISALMSGVMLKTAIYGLLRVSFDLLGHSESAWWWGGLALLLGLASALFGVLNSAVQSDIKRLLAYSSIENMGLILLGIGLALIFRAFAMDALAALALTAVLYHCLAHAGFKSLLFLCAGSVLHATQQRSLGRLGGLIHRMPWVSWLALVGVIAGAGLPPFSGFVAEWLLLQGFLFSPGLPHAWLNMAVPITAAAVTLIAALAGFALVKFFGVVFLGQARESALHEAHDAAWPERLGLAWLAVWSVLLGVLPTTVILWIDAATRQLLGGAGLATQLQTKSWWLLAPISAERASYQPLLFLCFIVLCVVLLRWLIHYLAPTHLRHTPAWDCGYHFQNARGQDTAEGFSQPIRRLFAPVFRMRRHFPAPDDAKPHLHIEVEDHFWHLVYLPIARAVDRLAQWIGHLQGGRIAVYLLYSFITLLALLLVARP